MCADKTVAADISVGMQYPGQIVRKYDGPKSNQSALTNMNAAGIGFVQMSLKRDLRVGMNVHPEAAQIACAQPEQDIPCHKCGTLQQSFAMWSPARRSRLCGFCEVVRGLHDFPVGDHRCSGNFNEVI